MQRLIHILLTGALLSFGLVSALFGLDPDSAITQYVQDTWGLEDGLPQSSILEIAQSPNGYLWLGTYEGVVRFDGQEMRTYSAPELREIRDQYITALAAGAENDLWVGTQNGLHHFSQGGLRSWTPSDGLANGGVQDVLPQGDRVWIGTRQGLNLYADDQLSTWTSADGLVADDVRTLAYDASEEALWIGTQSGLSRFKPSNGEWLEYGEADGLHPEISSLFLGRSGLWIGTLGGGVFHFADGRFQAYAEEEGLSGLYATSLTEDRRGNLWVGTQNQGLHRLRPGTEKMERWTRREGLSDDYVTSIFEDQEDNLWIGTFSEGLNRLQDAKIQPWTMREGMPHDLVFPVLEDRKGDLWIGTGGGGLTRFREGELKTWTTEDGLAHDFIWALAEDSAGDLWIGTGGGGLSRFHGGDFTNYSTTAGLANPDVRALEGSRDGSLWIGTWGGGLQNFRDGRWTTQTTADGLVEDFVMAIYEDSQGALWVATSSGASVLRDDEWTVLRREDGLASNVVLSFHEDDAGDLWIGTENGLNLYRDGEMFSFTTDHGLFNNRFFKLLEDDDGNLWSGCNQGIFRVAKSELHAVARGELSRVASPSYGKPDGMKSYECNGGFQHAGWKRRDGTLWFPTIRGVVRVDPRDVDRKAALPSPQIDRFESAAQILESAELPSADSGEELLLEERDFTIRYTAPVFSDVDRLRFEYLLEGNDAEWKTALDRRAAFYTNIAAGPYTFRVRAIRADGTRSEQEAVLRLRVRPRFHETLGFRIACALMIILLAWGGFRLRVSSTLRANRELQEMMQQLEQQNIELERFAYTVSHDLKNPLVTIHGFLGLLEHEVREGRTDRLERYTGKVRNAVQRMQMLLDELVEFSQIGYRIDAVPGVDLNAVVREAILMCLEGRDRSEVEILAAGGLPTIVGDRRRLVEVFVNLIDNAIRFARKDEPPQIEIDAELHGETVHLRIRDRGQGIESRYLEKIFGLFEKLDPSTPGSGAGLAVVRRVIELHGGRIWAESEGAGRGTLFQIRIPRSGGSGPTET